MPDPSVLKTTSLKATFGVSHVTPEFNTTVCLPLSLIISRDRREFGRLPSASEHTRCRGLLNHTSRSSCSATPPSGGNPSTRNINISRRAYPPRQTSAKQNGYPSYFRGTARMLPAPGCSTS